MTKTLIIKDHLTPLEEEEFVHSIHKGEFDQINWSGKEPLEWDIHWQTMQFLIDCDLAKNIFIHYTTNLSTIEWRRRNLFKDILPHFKGSHINATIMATDKTSEYLMEKVSWNQWVSHLNLAIANSLKNRNQSVSFDFVLTLPGLLSIKDIFSFINERDLILNSRVVNDTGPECILSPLVLPRFLLNELVDNTVRSIFSEVKNHHHLRLVKTLLDLKKDLVHEEVYPDTWKQSFKIGKEKMLAREGMRKDQLKFIDILSSHAKVKSWWLQQED